MARRRRLPSKQGALHVLVGADQSGADGAVARLRRLRPVPAEPAAATPSFEDAYDELPSAAGEWEGRRKLRLVEPTGEDS